jgi:hypothetical protein
MVYTGLGMSVLTSVFIAQAEVWIEYLVMLISEDG